MEVKTDKFAVVGNIPWIYPHRQKPPGGQKVFLLNQGNVATTGFWDDSFKAWREMFDRDREVEQEGEILALPIGTNNAPNGFRIPQALPINYYRWTRQLNAIWHNDQMEEVAGIFKMIDEEGYLTPIFYQYDMRQGEDHQFNSGFTVGGNPRVYKFWSDLRDDWANVLEELLTKEG